MKVTKNILDGFRFALAGQQPDCAFSPTFRISSLLLGRDIPQLSSDGKRFGTFVAELERFATRDFIPVVEFPASSTRADLFSESVSAVEDIIIRQAGVESNVAIGLKYMIDECTDNIIEHSKSEYGYIASMVDRENSIVDICLADRGITLLGSYLESSESGILSDLEAIQAANRGISTKNRPSAENRGYGLATTKKMIVDGLGGSFAMISGQSVFLLDKDGEKFLDSAQSEKIAGTIISMRIPYKNRNFKYINYVE